MITRSHAHTLRVLVRIRDWIDRSDVTTPVADLAVQRAQLDATITRLSDLTTHAATLTRTAQVGTLAAHQQARRITAAYLTPVVRAGRTMRGPGNQPLRELRLPRKVQFEQLASITNGFAEIVEEERDRFIAAGLAPDLGAQLRKEAADLRDLALTRMSLANQRIGAIQAAREEAAAGRRLVVLLDSLIGPAVETNPELQVVWRSLVRLSTRARRRGGAPESQDALDAQHAQDAAETPAAQDVSSVSEVPVAKIVPAASVPPAGPAQVVETSDALRAA